MIRQLFLFFIFVQVSFAQSVTKIDILNADVFNFENTGEEEVKKLTGHCAFRQDDILLYCDSAILYTLANNVDAFGHVHIIQADTLNIYSDRLKYFGNTKQAHLYDNVRVVDAKSTLSSNVLIYDTQKKIGNYYGGGKLTDGDNVLTSKTGYYYSITHDAFFKGKVVLTNPDYVMNSDTLQYNMRNKISYIFGPTTIKSKEDFIYSEHGSYDTKSDIAKGDKNTYYISGSKFFTGDDLYYDRRKKWGRARGHINFIDTAEKIYLKGNEGVYNKLIETTYVTDRALLSIVSEKDTLFMTGDTLKTNFDSTGIHRRLYAYNHVRIFKKDLQAKCDSLVYTYKDSMMRCFNDPIVWTENSQLTADFITLQLKNKKLDRMNMYNSSFVISKNDSTKFNQIKGKNMYGYFLDGKINHLYVEGNGQSIYYAKEDSGDYVGVNRAECSNMMIVFKENKVEKVTFIKQPEATFYPIEELKPEESRLKGFIWREALRPKSKEDLFKQE